MTLSELYTGNSVGIFDIDRGASTGSAFVVSLDRKRYFITDFHVIYRQDDSFYGKYASIIFHTQESYTSRALIARFELQRCIINRSSEFDIAIIEVGDNIEFENGNADDLTPFELETITDTDIWGKDICILGFPTSLKLEVPFSTKPFLANGVVSSVDEQDRRFVIDVPAFYGNSGSPVLYKKEDSGLVLCGVVQRLITFNLQWHNRYEPSMARTDWHNSGYTICRSITLIKELIENGNWNKP